MSKPIKELMLADYQNRFGELSEALVIDIRGVAANDNNTLRLDLIKQDIRVTVIRNTLARKALTGTSLEPLVPALDGPTALAYGAESVVHVARALVGWAKKVEALELKAAVLDGQLFDGHAGVEALSKYPTRSEAIAQIVQLVLTPGGELVGCALGPGSHIMGIVDTMIDKLEKGEHITKADR